MKTRLAKTDRMVASQSWLVPLAWIAIAPMPISAFAQIIPDNTLPSNSVVNRSGTDQVITGGTVGGRNLFHSFSQFSIPTGETASFQNGLNIQTIITRVTGSSLSTIDGLIRANGSANLFLLNPNGIVLGANARLDIGGSFLGSTANSIRFLDGSEFSAVAPQPSPLLTISTPVGLQYGANAGQILVQGEGNHLGLDPVSFAILREARPTGFQVKPGQTLALVGGDIRLQGGNVTAAGGRIELGSVRDTSSVGLALNAQGLTLHYSDVGNFGHIHLSEAASADVSGEGGGDIHVQGRRVILTDGSSLLSMTTGNKPGGSLVVNASELLNISGVAVDAQTGNVLFGSSLYTDVAAAASGTGSDLRIRTNHLRVADGGQVSASTLGTGNAGNIRVMAPVVELLRGAPVVGGSGLFANVNDVGVTGSAGNIRIRGDRLRVDGGAAISASTFGTGNAGNLQVNVRDVALNGVSPGGTASGIFSQVAGGASGQGGNIAMTGDRLHLSAGAQILAGTAGSGDAGNVFIRAGDVTLDGSTAVGSLERPSLLGVTVRSESGTGAATGNGGNLTVQTERLRLTNGAQIAVATNSVGDAGNLDIRAQDIELAGTSEFGRSGLFATAIVGSGDGGQLRVQTHRLMVRDDAIISASNFSSLNPDTPPGQGAAGNIQIHADSIQLHEGGSITAASAGGEEGNIRLNSQYLFLRGESSVTTNAQGTATGGNITIETNFVAARDNSDITANAVSDLGGQVIINAQGILGATVQNHLTPNSDITATSALGAEFNGVVELNTSGIDPSQGLVELPSSVIDANAAVSTVCPHDAANTFIVSGRGGIPESPVDVLSNQSTWSDLRAPQSNIPISQPPTLQRRTVLQQTPLGQLPTPSLPVEAQGWWIDAEGQVQLVAQGFNREGFGLEQQSVRCDVQSAQ